MTKKYKCAICGKTVTDTTCFLYQDDFNATQLIRDLCCDPECVDKYAEKYGDSEPSYNPESLYQLQQDDVIRASEVY